MTLGSASPLSPVEIPPPRPVRSERSPRGILVVDDEEMICTLLGLFLRQQGVPFWLASSCAEAVDVYQTHGQDIAFVVLDIRMPSFDGPYTFFKLKECNADLACYFTSGDWAPYTEEELLAMGARGLVAKPFLFKMLAQVAQQCLACG